MANNTLTTMPESLRDLLNGLEEAHQADLSAEEQLQILKETNAARLAKLSSEEQQKYFKKAELEYKKQLRREKQTHEQELRALVEKYDADAKLGDEAFKAKHKISIKEYEARKKLKEKELKEDEKRQEKAAKQADQLRKAANKARIQQDREAMQAALGQAFGKGKSFSDRIEGVKALTTTDGKFDPNKTFGALMTALSDLSKQVDQQIDKISGYKSEIDTRLQGSNNARNYAGSYWEQMSQDITGMAGISPLVKQSALAERVNSMVSQGIAFNVEQRALLQELSSKIATTFNAENGTLLRLIRIQEQDTTAGRLGMESALTAFLNNMYETTEYMQGIATTIKGSLEEAMSLMTGENALSFEYQVQKWLGSMYSVGMSQNAVQGLGGVLGKLAAGQLDAITSGGQGNLVIMAANQAGLSVADLLSNGLNADTTNKLMSSMVDYLAKIYQEAGDSKVIQQQMASVYGMTAADLRAATNLARSAGLVSRNNLTYSGAMNRLAEMANSMYARTSIGEMMTNAFDNVKYTMAAGIANNPALYATYKTAGMLDSLVGGLPIPFINTMFGGVDLHTSVADIMRASAMAGGIMQSMGAMINSGGNGGITGAALLRAAGVSGNATAVTRGSGSGISTLGGITVSESGSLIGNASSSDIQSQTMAAASDTSKAMLAEATDTAEETKLKDVRSDILDIYRLMQDVAHGNYTLAVDVKNPSLTVETTDGTL